MFGYKPGQEVVHGLTYVSKIGQGGMGAVYKLYDAKLRVHRALKVISLKAETPEQAIQFEKRFVVEAQSLARLHHPNIVKVLFFGELGGTGGDPYMVMEYVDGPDLVSWMQEEHPSLDRILALAKQLASSLKAVHDAGMVHRDIKLTNLLLLSPPNAEERLFMIDFGIAKSEDDPQLTATGHAVGTFSFMAPEMVRAIAEGRGIKALTFTPQMDLWAAGCVLYQLCTYKKVWRSRSMLTIHSEIVNGAFVPVEDIRFDISEEFAAAIGGLLQVDPTLRTQSAAELLQQLQSVTEASNKASNPFVPPTPKIAKRTDNGTAVLEPSDSEDISNLDTIQKPAPPVQLLNTIPSRPPTRAQPEDASLSGGAFRVSRGAGDVVSHSVVDVSQSGARVETDTGNGLHSGHARIAPPIIGESAVSAQKPPPVPTTSTPDGPLEHSDMEGDLSQLFQAAIVGDPEPSRLQAPPHVSVPVAPGNDDDATPVLNRQQANDPVPPAFIAPKDVESTSTTSRKALMMPAAAALVVAAVVGFALHFGESAMGTTTTVAGASFIDPNTIEKQRAAAEVSAIEKEQAEGGGLITVPLTTNRSVRSLPLSPVVMEDSHARVAAAPSTRTTRRGRARRRAEKPTADAVPVAPPKNEYAELYGTRAPGRNLTGRAVIDAPKADAADTKRSGAGVRIPVRLRGSILSEPAGPVVAVVTKPTKLGGVTLSRGAEVHGMSSSGSGTLIQVSFRFVIDKGHRTNLSGRAVASDGRAGIPAHRISGGASDIAAAAIESGLRATGEAAASAVGNNPLGAAIRGGTAPAAAKGRRLDHSGRGLESTKNARFFVYVESVR